MVACSFYSAKLKLLNDHSCTTIPNMLKKAKEPLRGSKEGARRRSKRASGKHKGV